MTAVAPEAEPRCAALGVQYVWDQLQVVCRCRLLQTDSLRQRVHRAEVWEHQQELQAEETLIPRRNDREKFRLRHEANEYQREKQWNRALSAEAQPTALASTPSSEMAEGGGLFGPPKPAKSLIKQDIDRHEAKAEHEQREIRWKASRDIDKVRELRSDTQALLHPGPTAEKAEGAGLFPSKVKLGQH